MIGVEIILVGDDVSLEVLCACSFVLRSLMRDGADCSGDGGFLWDEIDLGCPDKGDFCKFDVFVRTRDDPDEMSGFPFLIL